MVEQAADRRVCASGQLGDAGRGVPAVWMEEDGGGRNINKIQCTMQWRAMFLNKKFNYCYIVSLKRFTEKHHLAVELFKDIYLAKLSYKACPGKNLFFQILFSIYLSFFSIET